ncbi:MAG: DUF1643 domain-containing protein [Prevotellaceae bacterium]|jgi:hypothetical protein|nr:DUF1643 domain-containing protein [Prevotellaceae bacterium]
MRINSLDWLTPSFGCFADARKDDPTTQRVIARAQPEAIQKKEMKNIINILLNLIST